MEQSFHHSDILANDAGVITHCHENNSTFVTADELSDRCSL